jgi:hypothetical protein
MMRSTVFEASIVWQRGKHEVTGFRGFERDLGSLEVSHLADQDYFGRLAQSRAQCGRKVARVVADLALVDRRSFVQVKILDWIFDGDDVVVLLLVDDVDDCGLRGALAGAGWTSHEHEAVAQLGDLAQCGGKPRDFNVGMSVGITRMTIE